MGFFKKSKVKNAQKTKENSPENRALSPSLSENLDLLSERFGGSTDLIKRQITFFNNEKTKLLVIYLEGMVDKVLQDSILKSILMDDVATVTSNTAVGTLKDLLVTTSSVNEVTDIRTVSMHILSGDTVILVDGQSYGISVNTKGGEHRGVQEPASQTVVRGSRESFTEKLPTNTALIRRIIKDPSLILESLTIGRTTHTQVGIMYLKDVANDKVLQEVRTRLNRIDLNGLVESGTLEEFIQDETYTPFPTIFNSERPDVIAAGLLEGRVAILVDGSPFVLLVPALFIHFYQSPEDYTQRSDIATLIRILRFFSMCIAIFGPALYIGITTFHQEMLPTQLLISLAAQREGIPFPALVEALMMEITFEILREAGIRMPRTIGQTLSIVGALVIGQAAILAGIVSPSMVIVVSLTAIANFAIPSYNMSISLRMVRFIFMFLAASFGLFGMIIGIFALVLHLTSLRSFGMPYMSPFGPFNLQDQKDSIFRLPQWGLISRPRLIGNQQNMTRIDENSRPK
ncbi:spore germination protein [Fictibacillus sp. WQ 8-8]|uniref:spore germination protein n=1 Tax=Fictibacillus sp. WQ 8-8 TaxID=2938788 RepID=UPI002108C1E0|nr:spore germination protein [Fictibacillus sp. WQ 8-8]MCQ6268679.1 spore germination protein [Fictibacillus sp. WQ 8-8]